MGVSLSSIVETQANLVLTFLARREIAKRDIGVVARHWLEAHHAHAWSELVLLVPGFRAWNGDENPTLDSQLDLPCRMAPQMMLHELVCAAQSLRIRIASSATSLTLVVGSAHNLLETYQAFMALKFSDLKTLILDGWHDGENISQDSAFRFGMMFGRFGDHLEVLKVRGCSFDNFLQSALATAFVEAFPKLRVLQRPDDSILSSDPQIRCPELLECLSPVDLQSFRKLLPRVSRLRHVTVQCCDAAATEFKPFFSELCDHCPQLRALFLQDIDLCEFAPAELALLPDTLKTLFVSHCSSLQAEFEWLQRRGKSCAANPSDLIDKKSCKNVLQEELIHHCRMGLGKHCRLVFMGDNPFDACDALDIESLTPIPPLQFTPMQWPETFLLFHEPSAEWP